MEVTKKKNLKAIDILTDTVKIFSRNPNFILFTALTSLPLFLFSLYLQTLTQTFLFRASNSLREQTAKSMKFLPNPRMLSLDYDIAEESLFAAEWFRPLYILSNLSSDHLREVLRLSLLNLGPLNLLVLFAAIPTVDLASKLLHRDENQIRPLTLKEMYRIVTRISGEKLKGISVTFLYVVCFSTSTVVGFAWLLVTYRAVLSYYPAYYSSGYYHYYIAPLGSDLCFHLLHGSNLILLLGIYSAWGAIWNTGLVVSVVEDDRSRYGTRALGSAGFLCLRNIRCGMVLMLIFSAVEVASRAPFGFEGWPVIVVQSLVVVVGNGLNWVAFVVYFHGCVDRLFHVEQA